MEMEHYKIPRNLLVVNAHYEIKLSQESKLIKPSTKTARLAVQWVLRG